MNCAIGNIMFWLCAFTIAAAQADAEVSADWHFWPTAIKVVDANESGALFSWPEFRVLVQTKNGIAYSPAIVDDKVVRQLSVIFSPEVGSPVAVSRDSLSYSWGLTIPGGTQLRKENLALLEPMVEKFTACLRTLTLGDLDKIKEVMYSPLSWLDPESGVNLSDEHKQIASSMFASFKAHRCSSGTTAIPDLLRGQARHYLTLLLTGQNSGEDTSVASQLVIATLFHDLLFSVQGLWVRTALSLLQDFIAQRLAKSPALKNTHCLAHDYESFIDFVLVAKDSCGIAKDQFLAIAKATNIDGIADAFKPFYLSRYMSERQLFMINLQLATYKSSYFLSGENK
jgi:hypothetical protein